MKKAIRTATIAAAALAIGGAALAVTACGGDKKPPQTTVSWQCTGFTDELRSSYSSFDFMGDLTSDGKGTIYRYENSAENLIETPVTWTVETDRDGVQMLTLKDGIVTCEAYLDEDTGAFEVEYEFAFAGSYHRKVMLTVSKTVTYETTAAFTAAADARRAALDDEEPTPDVKTAIVTFAGGESGQKIEFYADKTAKLYINAQYGFDYTWEVADGVITLTSVAKPDETISSTADGGVTKLTYSQNMGGHDLNIEFTCSDISALETAGAKTTLVTFDGGAGNKIEFYSDHTAKLSAYNGAMNFDYTWTVADGVVTIASKDKPDETISSTTDGEVTSIVYTAAFLQGNSLTFTCSDISALA